VSEIVLLEPDDGAPLRRTIGGFVKFAWMEDDLFSLDELRAGYSFWAGIAASQSRGWRR
jgi:hypothetical protein